MLSQKPGWFGHGCQRRKIIATLANDNPAGKYRGVERKRRGIRDNGISERTGKKIVEARRAIVDRCRQRKAVQCT